LCESICFLIENRPAAELLGIQSRDLIKNKYDFKTRSLPAWKAVLQTVSEGKNIPQKVGSGGLLTTNSQEDVRLIVASRLGRDDFLKTSPTGKSISFYKRDPANFSTHVTLNNRKGLPIVYNKAIDSTERENSILVFAHDDLYLHDFHWVDKVVAALQVFDLVGLAGNVNRAPGQPSWAFKSEKFDWDKKENLSGIVGHGHGFPPQNLSRFGPSPKRVKLLDGLFLAIYKRTLMKYNLRFDERFDFHFYDVDFCRQVEAAGLRCGTWPISVTHASGGSTKSESWRKNYSLYLQKWGT